MTTFLGFEFKTFLGFKLIHYLFFFFCLTVEISAEFKHEDPSETPYFTNSLGLSIASLWHIPMLIVGKADSAAI